MRKVVVAITAASGAVYGLKLIQTLNKLESQVGITDVVISENAFEVCKIELGGDLADKIPNKIYNNKDFFAPFASGSSGYDTMFICPCTVGTLGRVAHGYANDLIGRAADVFMKERKKLIILLREMPFNLVHIENMRLLTLSGAIICPAAPSFYALPKNTDELLQTVIDKILMIADFTIETYRWGEENH